MATRRPATSRARKSSSRPTSRTQPKARAPRARKESPSSDSPLLVRIYRWFATGFGNTVRYFGRQDEIVDQRSDSIPFSFVLLGIVGAVFAWFLTPDSPAYLGHTWTFGLLFGQVASALPVIFIVFGVYLMRHPSGQKTTAALASVCFCFWSRFLASFTGPAALQLHQMRALRKPFRQPAVSLAG